MFVTTAISGRSANDRPVGLVALDDEPAVPAPALPPSCGTTPPTIQAGSWPSSRSTNAIIAAVVVLPCAPPTTIAGRSADELGEERRPAASPSTRRDVRRRDDDLPARRAARGSPPSSTSTPVERLQEERLAHVPPAHLRAPAPARCSRRRTGRSRRCRRSRASPAGERRVSGAARRDQLLGDLVGRVGPRERAASPSRMARSRAPGRRAAPSTSAGTGRQPPRPRRRRRRRRARSAARSASGGRPSRAGTARAPRACRRPRAPTPCRPRARRPGRRRPGRRRSGRCAAAARSRAA